MIPVLLWFALAQPAQGLHADHQPTKAGVFTTAANDALHLEAFVFRGGLTRIIVSDRNGQPLPADRLRALVLRVMRDGRETPMDLTGEPARFEGNIGSELSVPLNIAVTIGDAASPQLETVPMQLPAFNTPDAELTIEPPTAIPSTRAGVLELLREESAQAQALLDSRSSRGVYVAVTRVRDFALALEQYVGELPEASRARAQSAIREAVRTSWLAHTAADDGLPYHTYLGVMLMRDAIRELRAAFGDATLPIAESLRWN
jgi:hypothetical protein